MKKFKNENKWNIKIFFSNALFKHLNLAEIWAQTTVIIWQNFKTHIVLKISLRNNFTLASSIYFLL